MKLFLIYVGIVLSFVALMAMGAAQEVKERKHLADYLTDQLQEKSQRLVQTEWLVEQMFGSSDFTSIMSTPVEITAYTARAEECDETPEVTADMTPSRIGVLAISRDLRTDLHIQMGQVVMLEGLGVFKVHDVMNARFKRRVDILHANPKAAKLFGKRKGSLIWLI